MHPPPQKKKTKILPDQEHRAQTRASPGWTLSCCCTMDTRADTLEQNKTKKEGIEEALVLCRSK